MTGKVTVTFVGSGDAFGSGGRMQACILVDDGTQRTLVDCGASSLIGMKRLGIDPNSIDAVVLSHLHGDHFGGIPFLVLDGQFSRRERPLKVIGPEGVKDRVRAAMEVFFPGSSTVQRRFETVVEEIGVGTAIKVGDASVRAFAADHASGAPAHILRFELGGRVIAYSGDTSWTPGLVEAARGADLLICEAYFRERRVPFHLSYGELLEHRAEIDCVRIVLTHLTTEMIEAADVELERASDGLVVEV
ncbi:MAG: MBL fold metallo-hydrolase [Dehalococcoidia bacterium]